MEYRYPFYEEHHISSPYGPRGSGFHGGTDFGWEPETGPSFPVCSVADGTVCYLADESAYGGGNVINIDHPDGGQSRYFHLAYWQVELGQVVSEGEQIAMSGDTGVPGSPHLHLELLDAAGAHYDPVTVLVWPDQPQLPLEEEAEMPSYAVTLLRDPDNGQIFAHNGMTRRYMPDQHAINVILGTGLCNPNVQDSAGGFIASIPWDPADPYHPANQARGATEQLAPTAVDADADRRGDG